jgi:hypothetical protein
MSVTIRAWVDYEEWRGGVTTLAEVFLPGSGLLFELLTGVESGHIAGHLSRARADAPEAMAVWEEAHGRDVFTLTPNGVPTDLGHGPRSALFELGFVPPRGRRQSGEQDRQTGGIASRVSFWPPIDGQSSFGFSCRSCEELRRVADRYALLPLVVGPDREPPTVVPLRRTPPGNKIVVHQRLQELDAVLAMMTAINGDEPNRSRLIFWFER